MVALAAVGMIACGNSNPEAPGAKDSNVTVTETVTLDNVNNYIEKIAEYKGRTVSVVREVVTDELAEYYAEYTFANQTFGPDGESQEFTDEAVAALNNPSFSTKDEYVAFVKEMLTELDRQQYEQDVVQALIDLVVSESDFKDIPVYVLADQETVIRENFTATASQYGLTVEQFLAESGTTLEQLEEDYAKQQIVFYKIALDNGFEVSDTELNEKISELINQYSDITTAEDVYTYIASEAVLRESLLISKVFDFLMDVTTVVEPTE